MVMGTSGGGSGALAPIGVCMDKEKYEMAGFRAL